MIDKASIIKEAQKYLEKGQVDKAIAEWEKLAAAYPEGSVYNYIGDLYIKKGNKQSAVAAYHKASAIFRNEGFALKALALFKKILNLNPADADALYALGELSEEKNISTDAIRYYLAAAEIYSKENRKNDLLKAYERILHLAPSNIPMRVKISELFSREGFVSEAAKEYLQIGRLYEAKGELRWAGDYFRKAMEIQPNNKGALIAMSQFTEKSGDFAQALNYIKVAIERAGEDGELRLRQAHLLSAMGEFVEAINCLSEALRNSPSNIEIEKSLAGIYLKAGHADRAVGHYKSVVDNMIAAEKFDEALKVLKEVREIDPLEFGRKLVYLYRQSSNEAAASEELLGLSDIYEQRGMTEDAIECLKEASLLRPDNLELMEKIGALERKAALPDETMAAGPELPGEEPAGKEPVFEPPDSERMSGEPAFPPWQVFGQPQPEIQIEKTEEEAETEVEIFLRYGLYEEARKLLEAMKVKSPQNVEVHGKLKALYLELNDVEQAVTECLILAEIARRAGDEGGRQAFINEAFDINPSDPRLAGRQAAEPPAPESAPARNIGDYAEELTEAQFYEKQGFLNEARDIYAKLSGLFPEDEDLSGSLRELKERIEARDGEFGPIVPSPPPPDEQPEGEEELVLPDIPSVDAQDVKEPPLESDVLEIFEEFKKGLEKQVEAEDSETHYNLGIAYKEMGLIDDAINSFQMAQHDPRLFVQSTSMLGICYMEKGLYPLAVDAFQSALIKTAPGEEASLGLKYELACAFEKNGSLKEALGLFTEVYGWNSRFREVAESLDRLKKAVEVAAPKVKKSRVSYI